MSDSLLTPTVIANEALMQLENNLVFGKNCHTEYRKEFVKIGSSVTFRKPVQFTVVSGATINVQDVTEASDTITISNDKHVAWDFSVSDLTLTIEKYSERYVAPALIAMADNIDATVAALYDDLYWSSGNPGTTPASFSALGDMAAYMDDVAIPADMRKLVLSPSARWSMADALKGTYDPKRAKDSVEKGWLGTVAEFDIYGSQKAPKHTTGTAINGTILVTTAVSDTYSTSTFTSTVNVDGTISGTFLAGDVFTIANVYSVDPVSKVSTGRLQHFVVTANVTAAANAAALVVYPRIIASGAYQTVNAAAANNAVVTFIGTQGTTYPQNLAYHRNALALVMVPIQVPETCPFKARVNKDGYGLTMMKDFDIVNRREICRIDALWGVKTLDNRLGGRIWG